MELRESSDRGLGVRTSKVVAAFVAVMLFATGFASPASAVPVNEATDILEVRWSEELQPEHADVLRLYYAFFDREAEVDGAKYWINTYNAGANLDDISFVFANGPEFQSTYGSTTDVEFLTIVYSNVLGRTYDQEGFDYWLGQIQTGALTRHGVVRWIASSPEFRQRRPQTIQEEFAHALIQQSDLPGLASDGARTYPVQGAPWQDDCQTSTFIPYGGVGSFWADAEYEVRYVSEVIPLRTNDEASNYLNNDIVPRLISCGQYSVISATGVGQESISLTRALYGSVVEIHIIRQDNIVFFTWSGIDEALAAQGTSSQARRLAIETHGRL